MFIASKIEDISPMSIDDAVKRIAHGKFTKEVLKDTEYSIITALKFNVSFPTPLDYLDLIAFKAFKTNTSDAVE